MRAPNGYGSVLKLAEDCRLSPFGFPLAAIKKALLSLSTSTITRNARTL